MNLPPNWGWLLASVLVVLATPQLGGLYDLVAYAVAGNDWTISRVSQVTAWRHPYFQWFVCLLLGIYAGHVFTTRHYPRLVPAWLSLTVFVLVPYLLVIVAMVSDLAPIRSLPLRETSRDHPLLVTCWFLLSGAVIGGGLLYQTEGGP